MGLQQLRAEITGDDMAVADGNPFSAVRRQVVLDPELGLAPAQVIWFFELQDGTPGSVALRRLSMPVLYFLVRTPK